MSFLDSMYKDLSRVMMRFLLHLKRLILLCFLISDHTHWPDTGNHFFTLEATGYALLALLKGGHFMEAAALFKWLNQQRRIGGGYGSTQVLVIISFL